jgi:hypothetical protein
MYLKILLFLSTESNKNVFLKALTFLLRILQFETIFLCNNYFLEPLRTGYSFLEGKESS